ncbi:MAG: hypothetical protein IJY74_06230, partial [Oscillospiraceae bacterium]|nr:hypothetical protein [Oscillospiraceae bacterium]
MFENIKPVTRKEAFLSAIAGEETSIPEPCTREEYFLENIAKKMNGDSGGSGEQKQWEEIDISHAEFVVNGRNIEVTIDTEKEGKPFDFKAVIFVPW